MVWTTLRVSFPCKITAGSRYTSTSTVPWRAVITTFFCVCKQSHFMCSMRLNSALSDAGGNQFCHAYFSFVPRNLHSYYWKVLGPAWPGYTAFLPTFSSFLSPVLLFRKAFFIKTPCPTGVRKGMWDGGTW